MEGSTVVSLSLMLFNSFKFILLVILWRTILAVCPEIWTWFQIICWRVWLNVLYFWMTLSDSLFKEYYLSYWSLLLVFENVENLNLKVSTKSEGFLMGWKWDYFQNVSVFENNKYDPRESNIYLAIWPFSVLKKISSFGKFWKLVS